MRQSLLTHNPQPLHPNLTSAKCTAHSSYRWLPTILQLTSALLVALLLSSCTPTPRLDGPPRQDIDVSHLADPVPHPLAKSRYGNPSSYTVLGVTYHVLPSAQGYKQRGIASWYGTKFHGQLTSTREPYNLYSMTAAHKTLPLPCYARVTNLENGRHIIVKINDRGPFEPHRIIDLSYAAAKKLHMMQKGTAYVEVKTITNFGTHQHTKSHQTNTITAKQPLAKMHPQQPHVKTNVTTKVSTQYQQVGAFTQYQHAQKLYNKLLSQHKHPRIRSTQQQGRHIYHVEVRV